MFQVVELSAYQVEPMRPLRVAEARNHLTT